MEVKPKDFKDFEKVYTILTCLIVKLKKKQTWCPYCEGKKTHKRWCLIKDLWDFNT